MSLTYQTTDSELRQHVIETQLYQRKLLGRRYEILGMGGYATVVAVPDTQYVAKVTKMQPGFADLPKEFSPVDLSFFNREDDDGEKQGRAVFEICGRETLLFLARKEMRKMQGLLREREILRVLQGREEKVIQDHTVNYVDDFFVASGDMPYHILLLESLEGHSLSQYVQQRSAVRRRRLGEPATELADFFTTFRPLDELLKTLEDIGCLYLDLSLRNIQAPSETRGPVLFDFNHISLTTPLPETSPETQVLIDADYRTPRVVTGTPDYLSPERALGATPARALVDWQYTLAVFESLVGSVEMLFTGHNTERERLLLIAKSPDLFQERAVKSLKEVKGIPEAVVAGVERGLSADLEERTRGPLVSALQLWEDQWKSAHSALTASEVTASKPPAQTIWTRNLF